MKNISNKDESNKKNELIKIVMAKSYQINFVKNLFEKIYLNKTTNYQKEILDDLKVHL